MDIEEQQRNARKVVQEARKVIAESERALKKADDFFRDHRIDRKNLMNYLKSYGGVELEREVEALAAKTLREVRQEADYLIEQSRLQNAPTSIRKKFRPLV